MLTKVLPGGTEHFNRKALRCRRGTSPAIVNGLSSRKEDDSHSSFMKAQTPIDIFSIDKEPLVEQSHSFESFARKHPEPAIQDFDITSGSVVEIRHQLAS